ncbi:flagellar hook-basal body complex protein FliE [Ferrovum sp.]|jgi:flagellar hook-basal body complex protein FliE|uniref:flagellar hook-basal body complex protein FliE n=1 Tax=Ferrovum sp. TaxID=2609467 RepID=UPI0026183A60|nr:flagellar hook-basal body complex protein FliE [Ferrovum sp.]MBW8067512.1 flagellar hook-basal body complex protein FliE [Ferrovum sp.]
MNVSAVDSLLAQMQAAATTAQGGRSPTRSGPSTAPDFATLLKNSVDQIAQSQSQADSLTQKFTSGSSDVSLSDAMMALQKATITLQTGIQIRNKVVTAYTDIMNMQV